MLCDEVYVENHFRETEELVREIRSEDIASWMLNHGYFPEQYILPPSFQVSNFTLQSQPYNKNLNEITKRQLISISHPKTILTSRIFSIQHPFNYHDIIFYLKENWDDVINHLFHKENKIYSYSFPISLTKKKEPSLSNLRSGRMIYEWLAMAERDLILDAKHYQFIARTDISNFYSSIYTHSIAWAFHGRENALQDREYNLFGNKIDRLVQYANDGRTNGIPIGSVLSDLIAEIILSSIDRETSEELKDINFLAVRFKDDYRFLCESESKAKQILKVLSKNLSFYNLSIHENKTSIWLIFFSRYLGLGINQEELNNLLKKNTNIEENQFYKSILNSKQEIFRDTISKGIELFKTPKHFKKDPEFTLSKYLEIFDREYFE